MLATVNLLLAHHWVGRPTCVCTGPLNFKSIFAVDEKRRNK